MFSLCLTTRANAAKDDSDSTRKIHGLGAFLEVTVEGMYDFERATNKVQKWTSISNIQLRFILLPHVATTTPKNSLPSEVTTL